MFIIYINDKAAAGSVKENKGAHQCQDFVGALGFRRESWAAACLMDVLDCLAMCEEKGYHAHTGPNHEENTQEI